MQKGHKCKKVTNAKRSCKETSLGGVVHSGVVVSPRYVFAPGGFVFGIMWAYVCWLLSVQITKNICGSRNFWRGRGGGCSYYFPPFISQGGHSPKNDQNDFLGVKFFDQSRGAATPQLSH